MPNEGRAMERGVMKRCHSLIFFGLSVAAMAAIVVIRAGSVAAATEPPALMGAIHGADGKPMQGVAVSARSAQQTFTTTVYSDDKGEFVFPGLASGSYKVWAQAVGFVTDRADVKVDG